MAFLINNAQILAANLSQEQFMQQAIQHIDNIDSKGLQKIVIENKELSQKSKEQLMKEIRFGLLQKIFGQI